MQYCLEGRNLVTQIDELIVKMKAGLTADEAIYPDNVEELMKQKPTIKPAEPLGKLKAALSLHAVCLPIKEGHKSCYVQCI